MSGVRGDRGFRFQVSGVRGEGSDYEELLGCGGQRIELRGRRSEVRGKKTGTFLWERLSSRDLTSGLAH